jgi:hypothetical protein
MQGSNGASGGDTMRFKLSTKAVNKHAKNIDTLNPVQDFTCT